MKGKRIEYFADINSVPQDPLPEDGPKVINNLVVDSSTEEKPTISNTLVSNTEIQNENLSMCMRDCLSIMNTNTLINIGLLAVIFILIVIINKLNKKQV